MQTLKELKETRATGHNGKAKKRQKAVVALCIIILLLTAVGVFAFLIFINDPSKTAKNPDEASAWQNSENQDENQSKNQAQNQDLTEEENAPKTEEEAKEQSAKQLSDKISEAEEKAKQNNQPVEFDTTLTEKVFYDTTYDTTPNYQRDQTYVAKSGEIGEDSVTYHIVIQLDGTRLVAETARVRTKNPVNQIIMRGTSDYNLNNNYQITYYDAIVCEASEAANASCSDAPSKQRAYAYTLQSVYYIYNVGVYDYASVNILPAIAISYGNFTLNGTNMFFQHGMYIATETLDESLCNKFNLACGRWQ